MKKRAFLSSFLSLALLSACVGGPDENSLPARSAPLAEAVSREQTSSPSAAYQTVSAEEAKERMESTEEYVLLDVRTEEEYAEEHINGALFIPDYDLAARAPAELPDKSVLILIYCRSGRRSASSAHLLASMGYTRVVDFGGIINWPYGKVKD